MKITVSPVDGEKNLLTLLQKRGIQIAAPCGGNGHCGKCQVVIDGKTVLACRTEIGKPTEVEIPEMTSIRSETGLVEMNSLPQDNLVFAVDIGTTTVAVSLVENGNAVKTITFDNPQIAYGADVLSRIQATKKVGVSPLQKNLLLAIKKAACSLSERYGRAEKKMYVSGNTVMLHLFWGEDVTALGIAPYTPVFLGKRAGVLPLLGDVEITTLPCISSFVGADIVAGLSVCEKPKTGKNLFIDLGTNAEIALIGKDEILTTSTSAGPCFEAGNVSCGMPATDGAIKSFSLDKNKRPSFSYFGLRPQGLCGTGLIDVIGQLVKNGIIDKTGYLTYENGYPIAQNIILLQEDVRAFQTARSAVRSGLEILLSAADVSLGEVEKVFLAGGFSSGVNIENAVLSGLLPPPLGSKCFAVGNSSLKGTIAYSVSSERAEEVCKKGKYIDLGGSPRFAELFIKNIDF